MVSIGSVAVGSNMLRGVLTLPKAAEGDLSISFQKTAEDKWAEATQTWADPAP